MADNGDNELRELAKECVEEEATYLEQITSNLNDEKIDEESDEEINVDDNDKGLVDEAGKLTDAQRIEPERSLWPVKLALVKVCCMKRVQTHLQCWSFDQLRKLAFKIIHSTTKILPAWKEILSDLRLVISCMLRDVAMRWNSTFDLLEYALKHRKAINLVTQQCELGLRQFDLTDPEWTVMEQLHSVLNVSCWDSLQSTAIDNTLFNE